MSTKSNIIPNHIAIIMDGNGRWAQSRGKERIEGHMEGVESVRKVIAECGKIGVKYLTLYVFSKQNWGRPMKEVEGLMKLFCECTVSELELLVEHQVRIVTVGNKVDLPEEVAQHLKQMEEETKQFDRLIVQLAFNYGSREEITSAVREIAKGAKSGKIELEEITPELIGEHLYTKGIPNPDLLIRTSGELRLSNFLLWQLAYAEFYFTETLWPDFDEAELHKALEDYAQRERRYGKV